MDTSKYIIKNTTPSANMYAKIDTKFVPIIISKIALLNVCVELPFGSKKTIPPYNSTASFIGIFVYRLSKPSVNKSIVF